jgi:predicted pyridoxine 5'-phosphate oxidase superfamily flavin-nucleotide-binding protein
MLIMTHLPESVLHAWEDRDDPVILATVDENGVPNVIYVTCVGMHGDDCLVVADNYFDKTRKNVVRGGTGSMLFRDRQGKTFQVKGTLEYHTKGEIYDFMKTWNPQKHPGHAALALRAEAVFSGAERLV